MRFWRRHGDEDRHLTAWLEVTIARTVDELVETVVIMNETMNEIPAEYQELILHSTVSPGKRSPPFQMLLYFDPPFPVPQPRSAGRRSRPHRPFDLPMCATYARGGMMIHTSVCLLPSSVRRAECAAASRACDPLCLRSLAIPCDLPIQHLSSQVSYHNECLQGRYGDSFRPRPCGDWFCERWHTPGSPAAFLPVKASTHTTNSLADCRITGPPLHRMPCSRITHPFCVSQV